MIIWRRELAHGNVENLGSKPRLAQYITMIPARPKQKGEITPQESLRREGPKERKEIGKKLEKKRIELTPLGYKLLGN